MAHARTTTTGSFFDGAIDSCRNMFHAGLGVVATTEEQVRDTFDSLVDKGKTYDEDEQRLLSRVTREVKELGDRAEKGVQQTVTTVLGRVGIPSRDEIRTLTHRVETLTRKVDSLVSK